MLNLLATELKYTAGYDMDLLIGGKTIKKEQLVCKLWWFYR